MVGAVASVAGRSEKHHTFKERKQSEFRKPDMYTRQLHRACRREHACCRCTWYPHDHFHLYLLCRENNTKSWRIIFLRLGLINRARCWSISNQSIYNALRRSTIDINPFFSGAPHIRSSIHQPKTNFSTILIASRRILPWPEYTKASFISKQDWYSD